MKKNKIITFILVILPILSIYKSTFHLLSIADVILLLIVVISIFDGLMGLKSKKYTIANRARHKRLGPLIFIVFLFFLTLISMLINGNVMISSIINRTLRYGLFMYTVSFVGYRYFDSNYAARLVVNVSILATAYLFIQTMLYYSTGKVLPFIIPFLEPVVSEYKDLSGLINWYKQFYYRPQSFFMEPAHFSQYTLVALGICLFGKDKFDKQIQFKTAIFLSLGLILSTSSIGVIMGLLIWGGFLLNYYNQKITLRKIFLLSCLILIIFATMPIILDVERFTEPFTRIFQTRARTTDSISLFSNLNFNQKIFGVGLGNEELYILNNNRVTFMNSMTIVLLSGGYLGLIAYLLLFMNVFIYQKGLSKILGISLFILSFGSEVFFTYIGIVWMLFIYYFNNDYKLNSDIVFKNNNK